MTLDNALFVYIPDDDGQQRPRLRETVPQHLLREMGLLTGEAEGDEAALRVTQIPVRLIQGVRECCVYTADFGQMEPSVPFPPPPQLVTIPCRSSTANGRCTKMGAESHCPLIGTHASVETPAKERVELIVAPLFPGSTLSVQQLEKLVRKHDEYLASRQRWEEAFAPVHMLMDATTRGMQFWIKSWFG
ncbi:MAG: hypothetical protein H7835_04985 [Magnetococcus sp. XQGC-1]